MREGRHQRGRAGGQDPSVHGRDFPHFAVKSAVGVQESCRGGGLRHPNDTAEQLSMIAQQLLKLRHSAVIPGDVHRMLPAGRIAKLCVVCHVFGAWQEKHGERF